MKSSSLVALVIALVLALLVAQCQSSSSSARSTLYTRTVAPKGWARLSQASPTTALTFTLIFRSEHDSELEALFWQVSDPKHPNYGNFLTHDQIVEKVRLNGKDRAALLATLAQHGISEADIVLDAGDSWRIHTTVKAASSLFSTQFYQFQHRRSGLRVVRQWGACSLPASVRPLVELALDVHTFPTSEQRHQRTQDRAYQRSMDSVRRSMTKLDADVTPVYVPQSMASLYGTPRDLVPGSNSSVTTGVVEFVDETFDPADLMIFSKQTAIPLIPPTAAHIFGNNSEAPEGTEAALDIQWLEGVNPALEPWFWLESDPSVWMYTFAVDFLTAGDYPMILSVSYGLPEVDQCAYFNPSDCNGAPYDQYIRLVDRQFRKIGLIGVSLIVCSQDRGVDAFERSMIQSPEVQVFAPEYPGTSVYATAVGATETHNSIYKLPNPPPICSSQSGWSCVSGGQEAAVSFAVAGYLSGGGFSIVNNQPAYQSMAVQQYFNSGVKLPNSAYYNATGRGYPDIAAIGTNGYIVQGGQNDLVGGTSMSTPIIAATFSLIQAEYTSLTGKQLGFLNPLLYQAYAEAPQVFTDITVGDNCRTTGCTDPNGPDGFLTTKGWDPVTGLGSPVYPAWITYIRKMVAEQQSAKAAASTVKPAVKPYYKRHLQF